MSEKGAVSLTPVAVARRASKARTEAPARCASTSSQEVAQVSCTR